MSYAAWTHDYELQAILRQHRADPPWNDGRQLPRALTRSIQRFQAAEDGDGTKLIREAERAGDPGYTAAVRLFIAEEQNHARMLKQVLVNADESTIDSHWTDWVFVTLRRALGLRLELMILMVAEVVALRYYRALRDGTEDPVVTVVAARILADERRHVPFHTQRLREGFAGSSRVTRAVSFVGWWIVLLGGAAVMVADHRGALRLLGVRPLAFVRDTVRLFRPIAAEVLSRGSAGQLRPVACPPVAVRS